MMNPTPFILALLLPLAAHANSDDQFDFNWTQPAPEGPNLVYLGADGPQRIDFAGKLRMLSQRAPAAACNTAAGISSQVSRGFLAASIMEIDRVLTALEDGDKFLGIRSPEGDRRVLKSLGETKQMWAPTRAEMDVLLAEDEAGTEILDMTAESAPFMLKRVDKLVGEIQGAYADPLKLVVREAILLDIVGRQRVTPQTMSKTACLIAEGLEVEASTAELKEAIAMYDLSLAALRDGMPEVGVTPPPSEVIAEQLASIIADWKAVEPMLVKIADGGAVSVDEREMIFAAMNDLTAKGNDLSAAYARATK